MKLLLLAAQLSRDTKLICISGGSTFDVPALKNLATEGVF